MSSEPTTPEAMVATPVKGGGDGDGTGRTAANEEDDVDVVAAAILETPTKKDNDNDDDELNAFMDSKMEEEDGTDVKIEADDAFMDSKMEEDEDGTDVKIEGEEDEDDDDDDGEKKPAASSSSSSPKKKRGRPKKKKKSSSSGTTTPTKGTTTPSSKSGDANDMVWEGPPDDDLGDDQKWPEGWIKRKFKRKSGATADRLDNYWYSPDGKKFRSKPQVIQHLQGGSNSKKRGRSPSKSSPKKKKAKSSTSTAKATTTKKKAARKTASSSSKVKSSPAKKASKSSDDGETREKVISGYMLFSKENREKVKEDNPDISFGQVGKKLGEMWQALSENEKSEYKKRKVVTGTVKVSKSSKKKKKTPAQLAHAAAKTAVAKISAEKRSDPEYEGIPTDPLPDGMIWSEGWTSKIFVRQSGSTAGTKDRYWYSPGGKKFRSVNEVKKFMKALVEHDGDEVVAFKNFKSIELTEEEKAVGKVTSSKKSSPTKKTKTDDDDDDDDEGEETKVKDEEEDAEAADDDDNAKKEDDEEEAEEGDGDNNKEKEEEAEDDAGDDDDGDKMTKEETI